MGKGEVSGVESAVMHMPSLSNEPEGTATVPSSECPFGKPTTYFHQEPTQKTQPSTPLNIFSVLKCSLKPKGIKSSRHSFLFKSMITVWGGGECALNGFTYKLLLLQNTLFCWYKLLVCSGCYLVVNLQVPFTSQRGGVAS